MTIIGYCLFKFLFSKLPFDMHNMAWECTIEAFCIPVTHQLLSICHHPQSDFVKGDVTLLSPPSCWCQNIWVNSNRLDRLLMMELMKWWLISIERDRGKRDDAPKTWVWDARQARQGKIIIWCNNNWAGWDHIIIIQWNQCVNCFL